jgi:hypothetical protein
MRALWCLAALIVLLVVLAVCVIRPSLGVGLDGEGLTPGRGNRLWPRASTGYYWNREAWPFRRRNAWGYHAVREDEPLQRWAHSLPSYAGYAAPLEQSLPLYDYYEFLHGFPPPSRMPFNA